MTFSIKERTVRDFRILRPIPTRTDPNQGLLFTYLGTEVNSSCISFHCRVNPGGVLTYAPNGWLFGIRLGASIGHQDAHHDDKPGSHIRTLNKLRPNGSRLTCAAKRLLFWKRCWLLLTEHPSLTKYPTPAPRRGDRCSRLLGRTPQLMGFDGPGQPLQLLS